MENAGSEEFVNYTDAYHFKIYSIGTNKYLIKSYGTHGSGQEFYTFRLLSFVNNKIQDCNQCFDKGDYVLFEKNRSDKTSLRYDTTKKIIAYPEYKEDGETGFLKFTGKTITLRYQDGTFYKTE